MRIIGGRFKGARLEAPGTAGGGAARVRPTADRTREALFNVLEHGPYAPIAGARALDLFAGTGALGFEALSRGAVIATFIDSAAAACQLSRRNGESLGVMDRISIQRRDATRLGPCRGAPYSLIFLDPPYRSGLGARALRSARAGGWIAPDAVAALEESVETDLPDDPALECVDRRVYGATRIAIYRDRSDTA